MENTFIKEVVNGKLIEIEQLTILKSLQISIKLSAKDIGAAERVLHIISSVLKIDGKRVTFEELSESTDFEVFNFISEAFNAMTNSNLI